MAQSLKLIIDEKITIRRIAQAVGLSNFLRNSAPREFRTIFRRISEQTDGIIPLRPTKRDWEKLYSKEIELPIQAKLEVIRWIESLDELVSMRQKHKQRPQAVLYADTSDTKTGIYMKHQGE